jgi:hypothetical protein
MPTKISISDFSWQWKGYGQGVCTYTSPATAKKHKVFMTDMPLYDATFNSESPKVKDLETLKRLCKTFKH